MRFILPKMENENNVIRPDEYPRRTELITKMMMEGWLKKDEIEEYLDGIIDEAKPFDEAGAIFWGVDNPTNMPRDARVEWAYEPTYYIVAFMISAYWKYPHLMSERQGFRSTLRGGLLAATYRNFKGISTSDDQYVREVCQLFEKVGADQFLDKGFEGDLCPEFTKLYFGYRSYFYKMDLDFSCRENKR